jgi:hypothetical protein
MGTERVYLCVHLWEHCYSKIPKTYPFISVQIDERENLIISTRDNKEDLLQHLDLFKYRWLDRIEYPVEMVSFPNNSILWNRNMLPCFPRTSRTRTKNKMKGQGPASLPVPRYNIHWPCLDLYSGVLHCYSVHAL